MDETPYRPDPATGPGGPRPAYPAWIRIESQTESRNRLTTAFRLLLALPHL